jgi:aminopeptidase
MEFKMTNPNAAIVEQQVKFPPFSLSRLLKTVFAPKQGEKLCILIDLKDPSQVINYAFLKQPLPIQKKAYELFYQGLHQGVMQELGLAATDFYAYAETGGSNLELPNQVIAPDGKRYPLEEIYSRYNIILCIGCYSATAPLTAAAKKFGFRGSTMHGLNDTVLRSGLAVDYNAVSARTEQLRQKMTRAEYVEIQFAVDQQQFQLHIDLQAQEAQKSHGLCRIGPDVANLPAGEVYFVPKDAHGSFPIKFEEDGTLGAMQVKQGKIVKASLIRGDQKLIDTYQAKFKADPATAVLGELGFGTQQLPYSGADIQDEKIFGTFHLAIGRNDHLNGDITKESFHDLRNASHNDILFSSTKTPEIQVKKVFLKKDGKEFVLIEDYQPTDFLKG